MLVAEGRFTEVSEVQLSNAFFPMLVTEGMFMEVSEMQLKNAPSLMIFTVVGAVKPVKLLLLNALAPTAVTLYSFPLIVTFQGRTT